MAVVPFENLSGDPALDWLSRGISGTLSTELVTSPRFTIVSVQSRPDVFDVRATQSLSGYFEVLNHRLRVHATVRDIAARKTIRTILVDGDVSRGALPVIHELATRVADGPVESLGTTQETAARELWASAEAESPDKREEHLRAAIAADPGFPLPYAALAQTELSRGNAAAARTELARALQSGRVSPYRRARLQVMDAALRNDAAVRRQALNEALRLAPNDEEARFALAETEFARRNFPAAITALKHLLAANEQNSAVANTLAYSEAYAGNLAGARAALEAYRRVAPDDANALDSLGDVHFYFGRFKEAESYFLEAHRMNAGLLRGGDLYKAALARYYAAGTGPADQVFATFLEYRKNTGDALVPVREAVWEASTARLDQARTRLERFLSRTDLPPQTRFAASLQQAFFAAQQSRPARIEGTPQSAAAENLAALASVLTQPDTSAAEWEQRTAKFGPSVVGYALLLHGHYREAVPVWERIYAQANPNFLSEPRVMLAWAYSETGRMQEAEKLLTVRPLPPSTADPGFGYLMVFQDHRLIGPRR